MEIIYLMVICSVSLAVIFLIIFIIGAKRGQFEDDESPAVRILLDDEIKEPTQEQEEENNKSD
ncbi:cbb3-type cytochrome oxidase assembly protein CcoS [Riemerella columbina]|uniref:cbb3-type cytochrome oxidase assembly protein CcoS n=1 Tax=Riemerella columbina TaxID=103810 RepID=UPI00266FE74B|nr:cbb3-type cytochrome oxidase assembly protein CcoS [Riemerella columbina]WKS95629.1 cbb3-type cytochrome oxidase assembly protein CcoS [Riemerella columbina]